METKYVVTLSLKSYQSYIKGKDLSLVCILNVN
jgi:hypothetical protein